MDGMANVSPFDKKTEIQRPDAQSWNLNPVLQTHLLIQQNITVSLC